MRKKPTIEELQKLLEAEETHPIHVLPNGQIKKCRKNCKGHAKPKVITMKEALGGEYAQAA